MIKHLNTTYLYW